MFPNSQETHMHLRNVRNEVNAGMGPHSVRQSLIRNHTAFIDMNFVKEMGIGGRNARKNEDYGFYFFRVAILVNGKKEVT